MLYGEPSSFNDFKVSEIFTIPKEIFVGETGWLNIYVTENEANENGVGDGSAGGAAVYLYYKVSGETVTLSTAWFKE